MRVTLFFAILFFAQISTAQQVREEISRLSHAQEHLLRHSLEKYPDHKLHRQDVIDLNESFWLDGRLQSTEYDFIQILMDTNWTELRVITKEEPHLIIKHVMPTGIRYLKAFYSTWPEVQEIGDTTSFRLSRFFNLDDLLTVRSADARKAARLLNAYIDWSSVDQTIGFRVYSARFQAVDLVAPEAAQTVHDPDIRNWFYRTLD